MHRPLQNKVTPLIDNEERYISSSQLPSSSQPPSTDVVHNFYLQPDKNQNEFDTQSFESHELDSLASTPRSQRKVDIITSEQVDVQVRAKSIRSPDVFFVNPGAEGEQLETLDTMFDGMVHMEQQPDIHTTNLNSNGNNNNNSNGNNSNSNVGGECLIVLQHTANSKGLYNYYNL